MIKVNSTGFELVLCWFSRNNPRWSFVYLSFLRYLEPHLYGNGGRRAGRRARHKWDAVAMEALENTTASALPAPQLRQGDWTLVSFIRGGA